MFESISIEKCFLWAYLGPMGLMLAPFWGWGRGRGGESIRNYLLGSQKLTQPQRQYVKLAMHSISQ